MVTLSQITDLEALPPAAQAEIARLEELLNGAPAERRRGRRIHFPPAARPLVPWIREFLAYEAGRGATAATLRTYRLELLAFAAAAAGTLTFDGQEVAWARVGSTDIKECLRRYREQPRTHNKKLVVIRAFYKWAVATERVPRDLTAGLGQADVHFVPSRALTKQQRRVLRRLMEASDLPAAWRALLALGYYLGLRASEAAGLTTDDLLWSQRGPHDQCHVRVHGKRGRTRTLKLHPEALPILQEALAARQASADRHVFLNPAGKGITDKTVHAWMQALMQRHSAILVTGPEQGGRLLTYHDLRHDFAHRAVEAIQAEKGADASPVEVLTAVASLLGHYTRDGRISLQTVTRYLQPRGDQVDRIIETME